MRPVLANLGLILQIAGLLMLLPIAAGFYYKETLVLVSFFITCIVFFGTGFLLNAFSIRRKLNVVSSSMLLFLTYVILGLVGAIPYLYTSVFQGDWFSVFSDGFFESISGYTTTGFSLVQDVDSWPKSLILYRGLTQWIGGIGIVFILLAFLHPGPSTSLSSLAKILGIDRIAGGVKKVMVHVLLNYSLMAIFLAGVIYLVGLREIYQAVSVVFASISTGGFSPVTDFSKMFVRGINWILVLAMIVGAINFTMLDTLFDRKFKHEHRKEFIVFIGIIIIAFLLFVLVSGLGIPSSFFHVVSAATTTGFSAFSLVHLNDSSKLILMFLMFTGGMTVSTAGGIKVLRLMIFIKFIPWSVRKHVFDVNESLKIEGAEVTEKEINAHLLIPLVAILLIFISTLIFTLAGFKFMDSLFEVISAFSTSGLSTDIAASAPSSLEWLLAALMIVGRVEILPLLILLTPKPKPDTGTTK